jgi:transposase-like protein
MAKARRKRKKYTEDQRATILAAAQKDGLTALDVQKKYGVTPVTYYSWRKKTGAAGRGRRGGAVVAMGRTSSGGDLSNQVRSEVRSRVQQILPEIVKSEVSSYLTGLFGNNGRRGRKGGRARRA